MDYVLTVLPKIMSPPERDDQAGRCVQQRRVHERSAWALINKAIILALVEEETIELREEGGLSTARDNYHFRFIWARKSTLFFCISGGFAYGMAWATESFA